MINWDTNDFQLNVLNPAAFEIKRDLISIT